jgi:hypothetical protein
MSYYQQHDPRFFAHPQFPEPKKSSSWVGWVMMLIGALIGGFFLGQNVKIEERTKPHEDFPTEPEPIQTKIEAPVLKESLKMVSPEKLKPDEVNHELGEIGTSKDFEDLNLAERLFAEKAFTDDPTMIEKHPELAKFLGFEVETTEELDTQNPL